MRNISMLGNVSAIRLGAVWVLLTGSAFAQTPQPPTPATATRNANPSIAQAPTGNTPGPQLAGQAQPQDQTSNQAPGGGQILQLPDGSFVVAEPADAGPDDGQGGPVIGAQSGSGAMVPMPMHLHPGHRPPPSKAAQFHFHGPRMSVDVKCADDETTKACVDEAVELFGKVRQ